MSFQSIIATHIPQDIKSAQKFTKENGKDFFTEFLLNATFCNTGVAETAMFCTHMILGDLIFL